MSYENEPIVVQREVKAVAIPAGVEVNLKLGSVGYITQALGGSFTLYIDGNDVGSGRVEGTMAIIFSGDETSDVGMKRGSPITVDVPVENNAFTGTVRAVVIQTDLKEDLDSLMSREDLLNIVMARQ